MNDDILAQIFHQAETDRWNMALSTSLGLCVLVYFDRSAGEDGYLISSRRILFSFCREALLGVGLDPDKNSKVLSLCPWHKFLLFSAAKSVILRVLETEGMIEILPASCSFPVGQGNPKGP